MGHSDGFRRASHTVFGAPSWPFLAAVAAFAKVLLRAQNGIEGFGRGLIKRLFFRLHESGHVDAFYVARAVAVAMEAAAVALLALLRETASAIALTLMGRNWRAREIVDGARTSVEHLPVGRYCREAVEILRGGRREEARR